MPVDDPEVVAALAAAISAPRTDAPRHRLVGALTVAGDTASASFVRGQLVSASLRRNLGRPNPQLEADLSREVPPDPLARRVLDPVLAWPGADRVVWGRGLPERITVPARRFFEDGALLRQRMPLTDLTVRDYARVGPEFFDLPWLAGLRTFALAPTRFGLADLEALIASPFLTELRVLALSNLGLPPEALAMLVNAPSIARVRYLRLDGNAFLDPNPPAPGAVSRMAAVIVRARGRPAWLPGFAVGFAPPSEALDAG